MKIKPETLTDFVRSQGFVKVDDLAKKFSLSPSTVRRKLSVMEKEGLILRTHGGVKAADSNMAAASFALRVHTNTLEKRLIALKAVKLVNEGNLILLDAATTTYFLTEYLSEFSNVRVVTNGVDTLASLAAKGVNSYSTGGEVLRESPSILVGDFAKKSLSAIHADIAFFSASGITEDGEIYDVNQSSNEIVCEMIKHSDKVVCLLDNTKIGKTAPFKICNADEVDYIVCDSDVSSTLKCSESVKLIY